MEKNLSSSQTAVLVSNSFQFSIQSKKIPQASFAHYLFSHFSFHRTSVSTPSNSISTLEAMVSRKHTLKSLQSFKAYDTPLVSTLKQLTTWLRPLIQHKLPTFLKKAFKILQLKKVRLFLIHSFVFLSSYKRVIFCFFLSHKKILTCKLYLKYPLYLPLKLSICLGVGNLQSVAGDVLNKMRMLKIQTSLLPLSPKAIFRVKVLIWIKFKFLKSFLLQT